MRLNLSYYLLLLDLLWYSKNEKGVLVAQLRLDLRLLRKKNAWSSEIGRTKLGWLGEWSSSPTKLIWSWQGWLLKWFTFWMGSRWTRTRFWVPLVPTWLTLLRIWLRAAWTSLAFYEMFAAVCNEMITAHSHLPGGSVLDRVGICGDFCYVIACEMRNSEIC